MNFVINDVCSFTRWIMSAYSRPDAFHKPRFLVIILLMLAGTIRAPAAEETASSFFAVAPINDLVSNPRNGRLQINANPKIPVVVTNSILGVTTNAIQFGIANDTFLPADYDGDGKADVAVWRPGALGVAAFIILQSSDQSIRTNIFGQTGDNTEVIGDYDGDGKVDPAIYRSGASIGDPSIWMYQSSIAGGAVVPVVWGQNGDFPAPGDYDGDGKNDFVVQRNAGGGNAAFHMKLTSGVIQTNIFGTPTDVIVPGDYDGDGKTDIAVIRGIGGSIMWRVLASTGISISNNFGNSATDFPIPGDYNGDGKSDLAVWRPGVGGGTNYVHFSPAPGTNADLIFSLGLNGDYPVANFNTH